VLLFICEIKNKAKMKKKILLLSLSGIFLLSASAQDKLTADTEKTTLLWLGEKVTGKHDGTINLKTGWLNWQDNTIVSGEFVIDMTSLKDSESNANLEGHLKSEDFFGVEKFPTSKLVITGSSKFDKGTGNVKGNLTIKGITHPVEFKAVMQKKDEGVWFYSNIIIDRTKYNVRFGSGSFFENLGDKTIYDEFKLKVNLLVK
jgi:polyisoprenoid-binding protein YceI